MITVITVCLNDANGLERTIQSVLEQVDCEIDYIIKDGGSSDGTTEMVEKYRDKLENLAGFRFVSEPDKGLYDAMNAATRLARGEMVVFLNAGDGFFNQNAIAVAQQHVGEADIIYGDVVLRAGKRQHLAKAVPDERIDELKSGMKFCHQSAFIKTSLMQQRPYNTEYRITADYDFFLNAYLEGKNFQYIDHPFAFFEQGGLSYSKAFELLDESYRIRYKAGVLSEEEFLRLRRKNRLKKMSRKMLPPRLYEALKAWKRNCSQKKWDTVEEND